jgi:galactokinase
MEAQQLAQQFKRYFGVLPTVFNAPGRVNLIGEHTDYNEGFVMPCTIGLRTRVAVAARLDRQLVVRSGQFPGQFEFDLDHLPQRSTGNWVDYVLGIAVVLQDAGHRLSGANLLVHSEIPIGSGLSSSAAIEVASALALLSLYNGSMPLPELAKLCQRSENSFIGARVGVMDQFVSCLGKAGHALLLDCRSLGFAHVPIPNEVRMVVCNTMVKHQHSSGEYNRRREECEEGVRILARYYPDARTLRDISLEELLRHSHDLPEKIFNRCRHVVEENQRVLDAGHRLRAGDFHGFGNLMRESHRSLRDLYEVSCQELDLMVEAAETLPGYYGGRMTGGGFGGSTVNLVNVSDAKLFADQIADRYRQATGIDPSIYICSASDGAKLESINKPSSNPS